MLGSRTLTKVCHGLARKARISIRRRTSTLRSPAITLTSTGKKAISVAVSTLDCRPKPNQMISSGAIATLGTVCSASTGG